MLTEILGKRDFRGTFIIPPADDQHRPALLQSAIDDGGSVMVRVRPKEHLKAMRGPLLDAYKHKWAEYFETGVVRITLERAYDAGSQERLVSKIAEIGDDPVPLGVKYAIYCLNPETYGCLIEEVDVDEGPAVITVSHDAEPPKPKRKKPATRRKRVAKPKKKE